MLLTLNREPSLDGATLGQLFHEQQFICDVLEDVVREVHGMPVAAWKVHGASAIPAGTYEITLENSPRFGPNTITINDVVGFTGVRGHAGNSAKDTEGCLLFGECDSSCTIAHSRTTLERVKGLIADALNNGEQVFIEIVPSLLGA